MVTKELDALIKRINSTAAFAKVLKENGHPDFKAQLVYNWYKSKNIQPQKKYWNAIKEAGRLYGVEITYADIRGHA